MQFLACHVYENLRQVLFVANSFAETILKCMRDQRRALVASTDQVHELLAYVGGACQPTEHDPASQPKRRTRAPEPMRSK